eukprot:405490-Rhodomonas_salina.2
MQHHNHIGSLMLVIHDTTASNFVGSSARVFCDAMSLSALVCCFHVVHGVEAHRKAAAKPSCVGFHSLRQILRPHGQRRSREEKHR